MKKREVYSWKVYELVANLWAKNKSATQIKAAVEREFGHVIYYNYIYTMVERMRKNGDERCARHKPGSKRL